MDVTFNISEKGRLFAVGHTLCLKICKDRYFRTLLRCGFYYYALTDDVKAEVFRLSGYCYRQRHDYNMQHIANGIECIYEYYNHGIPCIMMVNNKQETILLGESSYKIRTYSDIDVLEGNLVLTNDDIPYWIQSDGTLHGHTTSITFLKLIQFEKNRLALLSTNYKLYLLDIDSNLLYEAENATDHIFDITIIHDPQEPIDKMRSRDSIFLLRRYGGKLEVKHYKVHSICCNKSHLIPCTSECYYHLIKTQFEKHFLSNPSKQKSARK